MATTTARSDALVLIDLAAVLLIALLSNGCRQSSHPPTIYHLQNYHFVSRSDYAADVQDRAGEPIPEADIDAGYESLLAEVDRVQAAQVDVLRRLIAETGCRAVFVEGVTPENVEWFRAKAAELRDVDFDELQRQLENAEDAADIATLIVTIDYYRDVRLDLGVWAG